MTGRKIITFTWTLLLAGILAVPTCMTSCGHDEPESKENSNHRNDDQAQESDPESDPNENKDNDSYPDTEQSPIIGSWINISDESIYSFDNEGNFEAKQKDGTLIESGPYTYDELKQHLYISIDNGHEVFVRSYRCIIDASSMTLYDINGKKKEFKKAAA